MDNIVTLRGNGGDLELEIVNTSNWTRCYLVGSKKLLLGADSLSSVVAGLTEALQDENNTLPNDGKIDSTPVKYAVHLEEAHHSLYYGDEAGSRLLFWQSDARHPITVVGVIRLTPQVRRQWRQQLEALLHDHLPPVNGHRQLLSGAAAPVAAEAL